MKLFDLFRNKEELPAKECDHPSPKPGCTFCRAVGTAGRSGEKKISFMDGSSVKVEIINESNIEGRGCYTFNILNDESIGWADVPIRCCPYCGASLRKLRKK